MEAACKSASDELFCDVCDKRIRPGDRVFRCLDCWNFDVCADCKHPNHKLVADLARSSYDPCASTVTKTLQNSFEIAEDYPCLGTRLPGASASYSWLTFDQVMQRSRLISAFITSLFPEPPSITSPLRVVICSENRVEWLLVYFAIVWRCATLVPLHTATDPGTLHFVLKKVKPALVVCARSVLSKFLACSSELQHVLVMPEFTPQPPLAGAASDVKAPSTSADNGAAAAVPANVTIHEWSEAEQKRKIPPFVAEDPQQIALIRRAFLAISIYDTCSYRSTGQPKGAMISYAAWNTDLCSRPRIPNILVAYAPLAHSTHSNALHTLCGGGRVHLYAGDPSQLYEEMRQVRPTQVSGPPRFWNVLYERYKDALDQRMKEQPTAQFAALEEDILRENSTCLGDRIQHLSTGSAPASPAVMDWMKRCFRVPVTDGYGAIEAGSITSNSMKTNDVEIKLVDWMEYRTTDTPHPRGEICVKSPTMASGYFEDPTNTAESFKDGWFHTGDIGQLEGHKYRIIDRKKNIFKLSQGLYISPEKIEAVYIASRFVSQIFVHGDSLRSYPLAVIVPPAGFLAAWAQQQNCRSWKDAKPKLEAEILHDFHSLAIAAELAPYERVRRVLIVEEPLTTQNGLLTTTSKLCRPALTRRFTAELDELYNAHDSDDVSPLELLRKLASEQLGRELTIADLSRLPDLGLDSLTAARLAALFNRASAHSTLSPTSLYLPSLPSVLSSNSDTAVAPLFDVEKECTLPADIIVPSASTPPPASAAQLLLTGSTGFLGLHLLSALLRRFPAVHLTLLVRAPSHAAARERLQHMAAALAVWPEVGLLMNRVTVLAGDLTLPRFGLSEAEFEELSARIDTVLHNAAYVNHLLPYQHLKAANVTATVDVIRFCVRNRLKRLHFISTVSVGEPQEKLLDRPMESELPEGGYSRSKYVAEQFVTSALRLGLPVVIYRVGLLTWHHVTGAFNPEAYIHRLVAGMVQLSACPDLQVYFNMVPVDFAAEAIIASLHEADKRNGAVLNVVNPDRSVPLHEISAGLTSFGYRVSSLPWREFRLLIERTPSCALFPLLSNFTRTLPSSHSRPSAGLTALIHERSIVCPVVTQKVIHAFLKHALLLRLISPPSSLPSTSAPTEQTVSGETSNDSGEMTQALDILSALGITPAAGRAALRRSDDSALARVNPMLSLKKGDEKAELKL